MTSMRFVLFAIIIAGLVFSGIPASAWMPFQGYRGGGVIAPDHPHQSIRLDSLEVVIRLKNDGYEVDAAFYLFNEGETVSERIVFPKSPQFHRSRFPTSMRFEGSINARKIEFNEEGDRSVSYEKSEDIPREIIARSSQEPYKYLCRWVGSQLTFPGHAETTIHVSYEAQYIGFEHEGEIFFIFGTGFGWKGAIGNAVVILDASEIDRKRRFSTLSTHMSVIGEKSAGWVRTPRSISDRVMQHEFRNFKPKPGAYFKVKLSKP